MNRRLRIIVRGIRDNQFGGHQNEMAKSFKISGAYVSDFLNEKRGAGPELLQAVGRYKPLEVLRALDIAPESVLLLAGQEQEQEDSGVEAKNFPDALQRAARAAMELLGCTADEVLRASNEIVTELGRGDDSERDADWWLLEIRGRVPKRRRSHVRKRA